MPKKKKGYEWEIGGTLPELEEHSQAKHRVLDAYIQRYLRVMFADPRRPNMRLHVVDGFCGGGLYRAPGSTNELPGSPFVIADAMANVMAEIGLNRKNQPTLDAHLWMVDNSEKTIDFLKSTLMRRNLPPFVTSHIRHSDFELVLDEILEKISAGNSRTPRAIFLLDQYGYLDATYIQMRQIFHRIAGAEIVLTFSTDTLLTYLTDNEHSRNSLKKLGLSPDEAEYVISQKREDQVSRSIVAKYITKLIVQKSGAKFYTSFFIKSAESRRSYWLVHLSNQPRARDEMAQVHWEVNNHFIHHGRAGLEMLGYDPINEVGTQVLLPYMFDDDAKSRTHVSLLEDLPRSQLLDGDGRTHGDLLTQISNDTPGTHLQVQEALIELQAHKEIEIVTPAGNLRRSAAGIKPDDRIRRCSQYVLRMDGGSPR